MGEREGGKLVWVSMKSFENRFLKRAITDLLLVKIASADLVENAVISMYHWQPASLSRCSKINPRLMRFWVSKESKGIGRNIFSWEGRSLFFSRKGLPKKKKKHKNKKANVLKSMMQFLKEETRDKREKWTEILFPQNGE
jgi:hypothetical protein